MQLVFLSLIFFATSIVSVATGSTSLITVPAMLQFGFESRSAIATNMMALTLMSLGGSLSFVGRNVIDRRHTPVLILLTLLGSVLVSLILLITPSRVIPLIVSLLVLPMALVSLVRRRNHEEEQPLPFLGPGSEIAGYGATFCLAIYGGFFSGGYVTLLTAAFSLSCFG